jgi:beta-ribofuranosylaminobenzene 5'-phosphate synthase
LNDRRQATNNEDQNRSKFQKVRVIAPSRLSFTLIDMNGSGGRRNGMASLSIKEPSLKATVIRSNNFSLDLDGHAMVHKEAIADFMGLLCRRFGTQDILVSVEKGLPANCGFGSKTITLLALGKAFAQYCGVEISTEELSKIAGRGGTSGGSVNLLDRGGFLVDGGHENPQDFPVDPRKYLVPSRYAIVTKIPPVLINIPFPSWPILIMIPDGSKTFGSNELEWFKKNVPIPVQEAHKTAHLVLMNLSTSVAEKSYFAFCSAVNDITNNTFFKQKQISNQPDQVKKLIQEAQSLEFIDAIGMSSMGPMCYAFSKKTDQILEWAKYKMKNGIIISYWLTEGQNHPAVFKRYS